MEYDNFFIKILESLVDNKITIKRQVSVNIPDTDNIFGNSDLTTTLWTSQFQYPQKSHHKYFDAIKDSEGINWIRADNFIEILGFKNKPKKVLKKYVSKRYKCCLINIDSPVKKNLISTGYKPKTIFIRYEGLLQLISQSNCPKSVKIWEHIAQIILPNNYHKYRDPINPVSIFQRNNHQLTIGYIDEDIYELEDNTEN
ncbi:BRO-M family protein [Niemeyer virus]|uniref:BRO-m fanily protein n=1 Tax=Acanthamoeba polyphaga mimivirus Kroon TaxID=3069720 RepID=A0A0G2Y5J9_9VIRU|nr:BRO-m fanily protein [Acanthamoeba polyphaga mimivirus]AKI79859.1 BRO-m fanily protein [Acanthamoeba polyphaga mimivirus Kroon]ALR83715.1 BRO-M family protein [Niemeyer virus]